ncbi:methyltransferase domain-containing protein [Alteromonas ponticola]|uniref:Methyltransferase domain-containing protein n=2 Tax=Alteromonas aquimaris TaxID=2998417 RepID=A0ABT3P6X7_9ALTE|nr:methyltransferase domain-containing protein [Alteromonas aquimaris]MCW8108517.1 methyltransferase domain-containing protein [Alteromonas aquimaris]
MCKNRHSYDEAKAGYVNLLPVQHKHSLVPGDNKQMVKARRLFHATKGYQPLMDELSRLISKLVPFHEVSELSLFEAGCGEGSYLAALADSLAQHGAGVKSAGIDISKPAIELASKAYKGCQFAVGSNFKLPLQANSQDIILQVFAPGKMSEYKRVLAPRGILVTVDPGRNHLWELKERIYATPRQHEQLNQQQDDFKNVATEALSFNLDLTDKVRQQGLLDMTPYVWKLNDHKRAQIDAELTSVTADFTLRIWQQLPENGNEAEHAQ